MTESFAPDDRVLLDSGCRKRFAPLTDILAIQADGNYTEVLLADGTRHLIRRLLKDWVTRLPPSFLQLSRSLVIQLDRVTAWENEGRGMLIRFGDTGQELHLSRTAAERFRRAIASWSSDSHFGRSARESMNYMR
ncbi:MAG: hypothetical protein EOM12_09110 [Verrucomicrobiae bacterium]|nr:hypothetical protein [Verrucomicrobiae bacterium]